MSSLLNKTMDFIKDYWPSICFSIGTILLSLGLYFSPEIIPKDAMLFDKLVFLSSSTSGKIAIFGACLALFGNISVFRRSLLVKTINADLKESQEKVTEYEMSIEKYKQSYENLDNDFFQSLYGILWSYLAYLSRTELTGVIGTAERITVYTHSDEQYFTQIGRYSIHPKYKNGGREKYPDDQGAIGEAWLNGETLIKDLPDPISDIEGYVHKLSEGWGISEVVSRNIKMKSRCFVGFEIMDSKNIERVGILLVESTHPNNLTRNIGKIKSIAEDKNNVIATIIEKELELRSKIRFPVVS